MQGLNPLVMVSKGFDSLNLSLSQPPDPRTLNTPDERGLAQVFLGKHYPKTGCTRLRGFRSVGIPAAVAGRFSRPHPFAAAFFTGRMESLEVFHRFISPNVHITVTEIFIPSILP